MSIINRVLFLALALTIITAAQNNTYEFLRLDMSPKAAALGGSYVANMDDPNVIFYNPAGIYNLEKTPVSFSFVKHLMDINSASLAVSHEFEKYGRFGGAVQYINYGEFTEADEFGNKTGNFGVAELAMIVGYSNKLDENFYYGANIKFIYSGIADVSSSAFAADLGLIYTLKEWNWNFGFSALNIGSQISSYYETTEDLPLDIRLGFTKSLSHLPFTFYFSLNRLNEEEDRFNQFTFGGEFRMSKKFKVRFGYDNQKRKELKIGTTAGLAGFNVGFGLDIKGYIFDYAFSSMGSIGSLHRLGISTTFE